MKVLLIALVAIGLFGCGTTDTALTPDEQANFGGSPPPPDYMNRAANAPPVAGN